MIHVPCFKPHLTPTVIPGEGVLLLSEDGARALHGRLYERLAPLLDGTRHPDDLVAALAAEFDAAHVYYALMLLEKNGHLQEAAPAIPADIAAFWSGLGLSATAARAALADFPKRHSGDLLADIATCRAIVEARGMEVLVLDQTRADVRMPVVKVIVPGLRHFWARFGPGRLYEVPVAMGWLERALTEDELNPIPIFF